MDKPDLTAAGFVVQERARLKAGIEQANKQIQQMQVDVLMAQGALLELDRLEKALAQPAKKE